MIDNLIFDTFHEESSELLDDFEKAVLGLEADPDDYELINRAFRNLHTLKGSAGMLGFELLEDFAHEAENIFSNIRSGKSGADPEVIQWSLNANDILRKLISIQEPDDALKNEAAELLNGCRELEAAAEDASAVNAGKADEGEQLSLSADSAGLNLRTIKVRTERLDSLLDLVGELVTMHLNLAHISKLRDDEEYISLSDKMERVLRELRFLSNEMHMVPVGSLFATYRRPVRDIAVRCEKKVNLITVGEETEFDRSIYEGLSESLLHLIRNAIDHGIEPPGDRLASGKSPEGEIKLEAFYRGSNGVIRISDDGKGLDPEGIRRTAVERGLITDEDMLSDEDLFELLYSPGFSTAEKVSSVSGRGVGMDAVRRSIQALRGSISMKSEPGEGTEITISLPLSITSTDSLLVAVNNINYLIPLGNVRECLAWEASSARGMLEYREKMIGCIDLMNFLEDDDSVRQDGVSVIVENDGSEAALVVDRIKGIYASVIKPLPAIFRTVPYLAGSALLGDGGTAFVLDIQKLVKEAEKSG